MLTVYEDDERIFRSLQAGATGYVLKKTRPDQLVRDIETLFHGGSPMSTGIARRVVETFHGPPPTASATLEPLTAREHEILALLAKGYRYREIADSPDDQPRHGAHPHSARVREAAGPVTDRGDGQVPRRG